MSRGIRRLLPVAALCLATLLGGCVIFPEHYGHGHHWGEGGWGWRR
jgi:hypothetical protein